MTAKEVREQKLAEGQEIGKLVLLAEARLGELFNQMPKATKGTGGNRYTTADAREIPPAGKFSNTDSPAAEEEPPAKPKPKLEVRELCKRRQGSAEGVTLKGRAKGGVDLRLKSFSRLV